MKSRCFQIRLILKTASSDMYGWLCISAAVATKTQQNKYQCDLGLVRCLNSTLKQELKQVKVGKSVIVLLT